MPPVSPVASSSSSAGFADGLGLRSIGFDRESGGLLERLQVRPELAIFEPLIRDAAARWGGLKHEAIGRIRGVERENGRLVVTSELPAGERLSELLEARGSDDYAPPGVDAALGFLVEILPALAVIHRAGLVHGTLAPGRVVVTPQGRVVLVDGPFAPAIEAAGFGRRGLASVFGVLLPGDNRGGRLDAAADLSQAALCAIALALGRQIARLDEPNLLGRLLLEVNEVAQIRAGGRFADDVRLLLGLLLSLERGGAPSAEAAAREARRLARVIGEDAAATALANLVMFHSPAEAAVAAPAPVPPDAQYVEVEINFDEELDFTSAGPALGAESDLDAALEEWETADLGDGWHSGEQVAAAEPEPLYRLDSPVHSRLAAPVALDQDDQTRHGSELESEPRSPLPAFDEPAAAAVFVHHPEAAFSQSASSDVEPDAHADTWQTSEPEPDPNPQPPAPEADPAPLPERQGPPALADAVAAVPAIRLAAADAEPVIAAVDLQAELDEYDRAASDPAVPQARYDELHVATESFDRVAAESIVPEPGRRFEQELDEAESAPIVEPAPEWTPPAAQIPPPSEPVRLAPPAPAMQTASPSPVSAPASLTAPPSSAPAPFIQVAVPAPTPLVSAPVAPYVAPQFQPAALNIPQPQFGFPPEPPAPASPFAPANVQPAGIGIRMEPLAGMSQPQGRQRTERPASYQPRRIRGAEPHGDAEAAAHHPPHAQPKGGAHRWKLAAAAVVLLVAGLASWPYLQGRTAEATDATQTSAEVPLDIPAESKGTLIVDSQPAGAVVSIDGTEVGKTPLKLDTVSPGPHLVTIKTPTTSVQRSVQVMAARTVSIDVPVYSGWVAVFSPIRLDVSERGKSLGTSDNPRIMLPPGRHVLTFSNRQFEYSTTETIEILAGEERVLNLQPKGIVNINASPWAEVWVDGTRAGETPLANLQVPLGTREFVFRHPSYGSRRMVTTITTKAAALSVDFTKPVGRP